MILELTVDGLVQLTNPIFIDVRSESEFAEATIPGAFNIPIFSDAERAKVGTVYKQISPLAAKDLGLSLAAPKLSAIVRRCRELEKQGQLVLFCWRGGMRSRSVAAILDLMGVKGYRLSGGYKAYRRSVAEYWQQERFPYGVVVIRGNTGTGKTELIKALQDRGRAAVDLEQLANNRGSVFGSVGLGEAPSQKQFEATLLENIRSFGQVKYIVVECESKRIGRVTLPSCLHQAMDQGKQVLVYDSVDNRVRRLVQDYTTFLDAKTELEAALARLVKRLGHAKTAHLQDRLRVGDYEEFARILLEDYYDSLYGYPNQPSPEYCLSISMEDPAKAVGTLESYLDRLEAGNGTTIS